MNILGLILVLINVGAIAAPVTVVVVMHQDNLVELIIPPEAEEIMADTLSIGPSITMPELIDSDYDEETRTAWATFSFTNPLDIELTVNSLSAEVQCAQHEFTLGFAYLRETVKLEPGIVASITIIFTWTETAENHFKTEHADATSINVNLININIDISGITIETPESINLTIPLPQ